MVDIIPLLVAIPVVAGLIALIYFGWPPEMKKRKARNEDRQLWELARVAQLPAGAVDICLHGVSSALSDTSGRIQLVIVGTFSGNLALPLLKLLTRCNMALCPTVR